MGALSILTGFALSQARRLDPEALPYLALNLIGSVILAFLALMERQWGFLLLEGVWALVSFVSILRFARRGRASSKEHRNARQCGFN
jgi:hypothetical protein